MSSFIAVTLTVFVDSASITVRGCGCGVGVGGVWVVWVCVGVCVMCSLFPLQWHGGVSGVQCRP